MTPKPFYPGAAWTEEQFEHGEFLYDFDVIVIHAEYCPEEGDGYNEPRHDAHWEDIQLAVTNMTRDDVPVADGSLEFQEVVRGFDLDDHDDRAMEVLDNLESE